MPFLPALVRVVDLTAGRFVRFTLTAELPSLALTRFDCFFITSREYSTRAKNPTAKLNFAIVVIC